MIGGAVEGFMSDIAHGIRETAYIYPDVTNTEFNMTPMQIADIHNPTPEALLMFNALQGLRAGTQETNEPVDVLKLGHTQTLASLLGMMVNYIIFQGIDDVKEWDVCSKSVAEHQADVKQRIADGIAAAIPHNQEIQDIMLEKWGGTSMLLDLFYISKLTDSRSSG